MTMRSTDGTTDKYAIVLASELTRRSLLVAFMKKHHFQYREAVNGLEALKIFQQTASIEFDVILMGKS
jgi:hypothetical protein